MLGQLTCIVLGRRKVSHEGSRTKSHLFDSASRKGKSKGQAKLLHAPALKPVIT